MQRWLLLFLVITLIGSSCTSPLLAEPLLMATPANASPDVTLELLGHVSGTGGAPVSFVCTEDVVPPERGEARSGMYV